MTKKIMTLCLIVKEGKILLGMKKRGFGEGRWNGFGGKLHGGESIEDATIRETEEECGITVQTMEKVGIHEFEFAEKPARSTSGTDVGGRGEILEVHVFRADTFFGEPRETEEMRPEWFAFSDIPYDTMWADDRYWFPVFLAGKKFRTKFLFGEGDSVLEKKVEEVEYV